MVTWLRWALLACITTSASLFAQEAVTAPQTWFTRCDVYAGEQHFPSHKYFITHNNKKRLAFAIESESPTVRFEIQVPVHLKNLQVLPSSDYELVDSVRWVEQSFYTFKLKFSKLYQASQLAVVLALEDTAGTTATRELHILPFAETQADFYPSQSDLFLGEVQRFEIQSNHTANLVLDGLWQEGSVFNYRLAREDEKAFIYIEPKATGNQVFGMQFRIQKPFLDSTQKPVFELPLLNKSFNIKSSRFPFLRFAEREVIRDPNRITTNEVQIDNHRFLKINHLYRLEADESANSPIVAELRPLRRLSHDKVLCELRPYHNHEQTDGFLYIKDGEQLLFLTNIDIVPQPTLKKVMVMSNGNDWTTNLSVRPGEQLMLRIEGSFLRNAHFSFGELEYKRMDSLELEDKVQLYQIKVPLGIEQRKVVALLNNEPTSIEFVIREHQSPRRIDFITVNYGEGPINAADITQPILFPRTVNDVIFQFDRAKIDEAVALYGKQHIRIVVRLEDKNNNLIESAVLGPFWGCPDESSVRYAYYGKSDCRRDEIKLNDFLSRKTNVLNEWGRIQITIEHVPTSYGTEGFSKRIVIYNRRRTTFDVDVSIPAGLFVQKLGPDQPLASLSGISFAMIAQFSFYKKNEIQKPIPFKIGAGFLAQNAFNFNPEAERDLGIIVLASVYPIKGNNRISFPLYGGFGYFLQEDKFFAVIGPGIRVSF